MTISILRNRVRFARTVGVHVLFIPLWAILFLPWPSASRPNRGESARVLGARPRSLLLRRKSRRVSPPAGRRPASFRWTGFARRTTSDTPLPLSRRAGGRSHTPPVGPAPPPPSSVDRSLLF